MRFRLSAVITLFTALMLSAATVEGQRAATSRRTSNAKGALVFAVTRRPDGVVEFEPIASYRRGSFVGSVTGESSNAALARFAKEYYRAGRRYRLMWGGAEAGALVVKASQMKAECSRASATADVETSVSLGGNLMALATDSPTLGRAQPSRRPPTDAERALVVERVREIFRQKGVPDAALGELKTINLTATDADGDGAFEFIGTFMVKRRADAVDVLFLLAEASGGALKVGVSRHEQLEAEQMPDAEALESVGQSAFLAEMLIDQLDVDGDGKGEVFTISYSFEGTHYSIYKKGAKGWTRVQEFYNYRCAY